jgi:hypothetical protein
MSSAGGSGEPPPGCFASMRQRSFRGGGERGDSARRPLVRYTYRFGNNMADGDGRMKDLLGGAVQVESRCPHSF